MRTCIQKDFFYSYYSQLKLLRDFGIIPTSETTELLTVAETYHQMNETSSFCARGVEELLFWISFHLEVG